MPTDTELAWFTGIFEGEGHIETMKRSTARLRIAMTDRDIIERLNTIFPGLPIAVRPAMKPREAHHNQPRPIYVWSVGRGEQVTEILRLMLPYLGERRAARAVEALAHIASRPAPGSARRPHICANGHDLSEDDNRVLRGGVRPQWQCRACAREYTRQYRLRKAGQVISA
jgi:hypothetical protein